MKRARLADGRVLRFSDDTDHETIKATVKNLLGKEAQDKADAQRKQQEDAALSQHKLQMEEQSRQQAAQRMAERERLQREDTQRKEAMASQARQEDVAMSLRKGNTLESLAKSMAAIAGGVEILASIDARVGSLEKSISTLGKTVFASSNSITETLKMPKQIVKNERGTITGLKVTE